MGPSAPPSQAYSCRGHPRYTEILHVNIPKQPNTVSGCLEYEGKSRTFRSARKGSSAPRKLASTSARLLSLAQYCIKQHQGESVTAPL